MFPRLDDFFTVFIMSIIMFSARKSSPFAAAEAREMRLNTTAGARAVLGAQQRPTGENAQTDSVPVVQMNPRFAKHAHL